MRSSRPTFCGRCDQPHVGPCGQTHAVVVTNLMPVLVTKLLQALTTHHSWHGLSRQPLLNGEDVGGTSRTGANESPKNFILLIPFLAIFLMALMLTYQSSDSLTTELITKKWAHGRSHSSGSQKHFRQVWFGK